jgi:hypothetical protein
MRVLAQFLRRTNAARSHQADELMGPSTAAASVRRRSILLLFILLVTTAILAAIVMPESYSGPRRAVDDANVIDDFSGDSDGAKVVTDSGLKVDLFPANSARTPRVADGKLTFDASDGVLGGYYVVRVPSVRNASVDFSFTPWSAGGGLVCLAFMEHNIALTSPVVPRSPLHFTLSPTNWSVDVFDEMGGKARTVVDGAFEPALSADGITKYTLRVRLDPENGAAEITLPTGEILTSLDTSFGIPADFAYLEMWRNEADSDETLALVHAWAADSEHHHIAPNGGHPGG